jgi:hypothetical protein
MDPLTATVAVSPVTIGLIALMPPILLAGLQGWMQSRKDKRDAERLIAAAQATALLKKEEREEDYARQDLVAKRVADAAAEVRVVAQRAADAAIRLEEAQKETISRTDEVARIAAENDRHISEKLSEIHTLVNSDMTAARTAERDGAKLLVLALKRLVAGGHGTPQEEEEIVRVEKRIEELGQILADRNAAQAKVDADAKAAYAVGGKVDRRKPGALVPPLPLPLPTPVL